MQPVTIMRIAGRLSVFLLCFAQIALLQADELPDFRQLVKENRAAVVNISNTQTIRGSQPFRIPDLPEFPDDNPFYEFFKRFLEQFPELERFPRPPGDSEMQSLGSGFIISTDGYILTGSHVVRNADKIIVRLSDRQEQEAKVIGMDEQTDVALLKIDADRLPTVKIGDSDRLEVGEWVVAIGSPFGLEYTATQGIVSALSRSLPNQNYVPFIQTDAAVNPGNSGGPLFNARGEVVGVNAQIYTRTGGYMGVSFAIPINLAMNAVEQLKNQGHVSRGWLGVVIQDVNQALAESFGLDRPRGALVAKILPDSPAVKAGFEVGDIILTYDDGAVEQSSQLPAMVGATPLGNTVVVSVFRQGKTERLRVKIAQREPEDKTSVPVSEQGKVSLNLKVADLSEEQRAELGVGERGVMVIDVAEGPATTAGIQPDDVILNLNHEDVTSADQFNHLLNRLPKGKPVPVLVHRGGSPLYLALKLPAED